MGGNHTINCFFYTLPLLHWDNTGGGFHAQIEAAVDGLYIAGVIIAAV